MAAFKCKMCGGDLQPAEGVNVVECEFCGTTQTIATADSEKKTNLFNRANRLRMASEFDKAAGVYESIVAEFPEEAEAYWGLCLCAYGIEYVDDPATGRKIPTCHRTLPESIMDSGNFEMACEYADSVAKKLYREEAKEIDRLQREILSIVANEEPYDVFICYKETDEAGGRTEDSVLGQDIYDALTAKGLKVFFARITLEDKLGKQYEPYIYSALHTAKVMLALGTNYDYYDAVWVKNEWSRYLDMASKDKTKTLIPCYKNIDAYDIPKEFRNLQAQDMSKLGWMQDLVRGVMKLTGAEENTPAQEKIVEKVIVNQSGSATVESLMKRAQLFLEDGDWTSAVEYLNKVLDANPEYAPAYVGKVMAAQMVRREDALGRLSVSFEKNADWQKAIRFAAPEQKAVYLKYQEGNRAATEKARREQLLQSAQKEFAAAITASACAEIAKKYCTKVSDPAFDEKIFRMHDERLLAMCRAELSKAIKPDRCLSIAEEYCKAVGSAASAEIRAAGQKCANELMEKEYQELVERMKSANSATAVAGLAARFEKLGDYRDSAAKAAELWATAEEIRRALEEQQRIEESRIAAAKRKKQNTVLAVLITAVVILAALVLYMYVLAPAMKYNKATEALNAGEYDTAYSLFEDLGEYRDSITMRRESRYRKGMALMEAGEYDAACDAFLSIPGYKDVDNLLTTDENLVAAAAAAPDAMFAVGNIVEFGCYPQTSGGTDNTPIEWLVLERNGSNALLISRYALDCQPYNKGSESVTWETCTLRAWLNDNFLNRAFTAEEQSGIVLTTVTADKNQFGTNPGNDVQDKVFLLSIEEAEALFATDEARNCKPTAYADEHGAFTRDSGECCWWLRSPGRNRSYASCVLYGGVNRSGTSVDSDDDAVRPALWVNLESGIF